MASGGKNGTISYVYLFLRAKKPLSRFPLYSLAQYHMCMSKPVTGKGNRILILTLKWSILDTQTWVMQRRGDTLSKVTAFPARKNDMSTRKTTNSVCSHLPSVSKLTIQW